MKRVVVDTNVAIVANGAVDVSHRATAACRLAAVARLTKVVESQCVYLDLEGAIAEEYRRYLNPRGQPGVGDRFYLHVVNSAPGRVERVTLGRGPDGEYEDVPQSLADAGFDRSDRKFVALARKAKAVVINATDSDWIEHAQTLKREGLAVENLCGGDPAGWFDG